MLFRFLSSKRPRSVISEREFREVVEREKARAERYGSPLSIVEFRHARHAANDRVVRRVGRALSRRLRATDRVGWMRTGSIAAVLPDTDRTGAAKLASELEQRVRRRYPSISVAIDSYGR